VTRLRAKDLDESADLTYALSKDMCQAINERGLPVKDLDCLSFFTINKITGELSVIRNVDREEVEQFLLGVIVSDLNSEIGEQKDTGI